MACLRFVQNDAPDVFSRVHIVERVVNVSGGVSFGNERVYLQFSVHVVVDKCRQLRATFVSTEG